MSFSSTANETVCEKSSGDTAEGAVSTATRTRRICTWGYTAQVLDCKEEGRHDSRELEVRGGADEQKQREGKK